MKRIVTDSYVRWDGHQLPPYETSAFLAIFRQITSGDNDFFTPIYTTTNLLIYDEFSMMFTKTVINRQDLC
jgi:hypothetical protein